jgi:cyclopropane fatty-acyl-phospholipid synthase-like methyltransferase
MSSFDKKAKDWDKLPRRVQNALSIADAIEQKISLSKDMQIVDFGVGTGLLGFEIAKNVKKVYGIDTSIKMLEEIKSKNTPNLSLEPMLLDLTKEKCNLKVDGIVSSMTLHHIDDIYDLFKKFYEMLNEGGFIAIADLIKEDGTFHSDNNGVKHFGFEKFFLFDILRDLGYKDLDFQITHTISKPHKDFDIFGTD